VSHIPVKLSESDPSLSNVFRELERRLASRSELSGLTVEVRLLPNFDAVPEAQLFEVYRREPMLYRASEKRILLNASRLSDVPDGALPGALAHEIAHALFDQKPNAVSIPAGSSAHECLRADWLACTWGFHAELRKEREQSYGDDFCAALDTWQDPQRFFPLITKAPRNPKGA